MVDAEKHLREKRISVIVWIVSRRSHIQLKNNNHRDV